MHFLLYGDVDLQKTLSFVFVSVTTLFSVSRVETFRTVVQGGRQWKPGDRICWNCPSDSSAAIWSGLTIVKQAPIERRPRTLR